MGDLRSPSKPLTRGLATILNHVLQIAVQVDSILAHLEKAVDRVHNQRDKEICGPSLAMEMAEKQLEDPLRVRTGGVPREGKERNTVDTLSNFVRCRPCQRRGERNNGDSVCSEGVGAGEVGDGIEVGVHRRPGASLTKAICCITGSDPDHILTAEVLAAAAKTFETI